MNNLQLTNYELKGVLGQGGMSVVYLGEHRNLQSKVAIKVLNRTYVQNEHIRKRFIMEAQNMFRMKHVNIVGVTDMIDDGETVAFVMEYVEGWTLRDYLERKGMLMEEEISQILVQMLDALDYVHSQGLVHRDIKPANILLTSGGVVKLMDFGIAKQLSQGGILTGTNQQLGTPMYMSPEQIKSTKDVTYVSDLYSLGVVLWEMVTGRKPYNGERESTYEIQTRIVREELPLTGTRWDIIIGCSTVKDEGGRYRSAKEFRAAVERLIHGEPPIRHPDDPTVVEEGKGERKRDEKLRSEVKGGKTAPVSQIIAAIVLLGLLAGGYVIWSWWKERSGEERVRIEKQEISVELSTRAISSIKDREAMSGGIILRAGSSGIIAKGLVWSRSVKPGISLSTKTNEGRDATDFSSKLTNLSPDTRYYVRAYATTSSGTEYGDELTFVTQGEKKEISVELSTRAISSIKDREAMSGGIILRAGSSDIIAKGLVWSRSVKPEISLSTKTNEGRDATDFSSKLTNLSPDTRYYVRAYATTSSGTEYGDELTFVTQGEKQEISVELSTRTISSIKDREAMSGGIILRAGSSGIIAKGLVWSRSVKPEISLSTKTNEGRDATDFSSKLTNLSPDTRYYVRAYATTSSGTEYGDELTFVTQGEKKEILVELSTRAISSIKDREAMSGGIILRAGSSGIIAKGLVWSRSVKPEISLSTKTNEGRDATDFSSKLTNLSPDTRYYVRAYATTSSGTEYGDELTFVTQGEVSTPSGTVSIGSQVWQTKNLNVDRFRNGDLIPQAQSTEAWEKAGDNEQPAWCYYDNNPENGKIYGKLYNWYAVNDRRGICPQGWHVPSDTEWTKLTNYLGGEEMAGGKMKARGTTYWDSPNKDATNESGFSALPGGGRSYNVSFIFINIRGNAFFSSATTHDLGFTAWFRELNNDNGSVDKFYYLKSSGASVRCLRD